MRKLLVSRRQWWGPRVRRVPMLSAEGELNKRDREVERDDAVSRCGEWCKQYRRDTTLIGLSSKETEIKLK
jgi:hypothetical protein